MDAQFIESAKSTQAGSRMTTPPRSRTTPTSSGTTSDWRTPASWGARSTETIAAPLSCFSGIPCSLLILGLLLCYHEAQKVCTFCQGFTEQPRPWASAALCAATMPPTPTRLAGSRPPWSSRTAPKPFKGPQLSGNGHLNQELYSCKPSFYQLYTYLYLVPIFKALLLPMLQNSYGSCGPYQNSYGSCGP